MFFQVTLAIRCRIEFIMWSKGIYVVILAGVQCTAAVEEESRKGKRDAHGSAILWAFSAFLVWTLCCRPFAVPSGCLHEPYNEESDRCS